MNFATLTDDPLLNLASAVIAASARDGEVDELVPILDQYMYEATGYEHVGLTLALNCYCGPTRGRSNLLREQRHKHGIAMAKLAKQVGVTIGAISSIEHYGSVPNAATQVKFAEALNCAVCDIWPTL